MSSLGNKQYWSFDHKRTLFFTACRCLMFALSLLANSFAWLILVCSNHTKPAPIVADMKGKTVVISGGAGGIGLEASRKFASFGGNVVIVDRDKDNGAKIVNELNNRFPSTHAEFVFADYVSFQSVREAAYHIRNKYPNIHILCNNAGTNLPNNSLTEDGYPLTFQINYLSHFLFTQILMPNLKNDSRVIYTSSSFHRFGAKRAESLLVSTLYGEPYSVMYPDGKQAFILNCIHMRNALASKIHENSARKKENTDLFSLNLGEDERQFGGPLFISVDPGAVNSNIWYSDASSWNPLIHLARFTSKCMLSCSDASEVIVGAATRVDAKKHILWCANKDELNKNYYLLGLLQKCLGLKAINGEYVGFYPSHFCVCSEADLEAEKLFKVSEILVQGHWEGKQTADKIRKLLDGKTSLNYKD